MHPKTKETETAAETPAPESEVSRQQLEAAPERALTFLRAVGTSTAIRGALASVGYTEEDHAQGWALMHKTAGFNPVKPLADAGDAAVRAAIAELDAWDEPGFRRANAALTHHFPEQARFVFENLSASQGAESVVGIAKFLDRVDALEKGRSDSTRKADREAVALLAKRAITKEVRAHLAALVKTAQTVKVAAATPSDDGTAAHEADLKALHAWHADWADTARSVIHRRDYLIRLGLAKRHQNNDGESDPAPAPAAAPAAAAPAK